MAKPKKAVPIPLERPKTSTSRTGVFKFITSRTTLVSTKKMLASLANQHVQNSVAFSNRATIRVREALLFLKKLDETEQRLLQQGLLDDDADEREDARLVRATLEHLNAASKSLEVLRLRKIEAGIAFEESLDPIYRPSRVRKQPSTPGQEQVPAEVVQINMQLFEIGAQTPAHVAVSSAPPLVVVKFDADLLEQARRELSEPKELGENGI